VCRKTLRRLRTARSSSRLPRPPSCCRLNYLMRMLHDAARETCTTTRVSSKNSTRTYSRWTDNFRPIHITFHHFFTSAAGGLQSIVTSMSVCPSACVTQPPHGQTSPNFSCMFPVAVARSCYGGVAICYVVRSLVDDVMFLYIMAVWAGVSCVLLRGDK